MAENNMQIVIPIQSSQADLISAVSSAFATASGLTADADGVFWLNTTKTLGVKAKEYSSNQATFAVVDFSGAVKDIGTRCAYTSESYLTYNVSANATVFAFGLADTSTSYKSLNIILAKDGQGVTSVIAITTASALKEYFPNKAELQCSLNSQMNANIQNVTLVKMPTMMSRTTFSELYQIYSTPSVTYTTDCSIYVSGELYKICSSATSGLGLAFKV